MAEEGATVDEEKDDYAMMYDPARVDDEVLLENERNERQRRGVKKRQKWTAWLAVALALFGGSLVSLTYMPFD